MPEIGTSGLMSGDGKRGGGNVALVPAPILDSTCRVPTLGTLFAQALTKDAKSQP